VFQLLRRLAPTAIEQRLSWVAREVAFAFLSSMIAASVLIASSV